MNESIEQIREMAEAGDPEAMLELGWRFHYGHGIKPNYVQALHWYQRAADSGKVPVAFARIGMLYASGKGVTKDLVKAFVLYQEAANHGSPFGTYLLSMCYRKGHGTLRDYSLYRQTIEAAAGLGDAESQAVCGSMYYSGHFGAKRDHSKAVYWFEKAAQQDCAESCFGLAMCLLNGDGVEQSSSEACTWFQRGADLGDKWCLRELGRCYEIGEGVKKDLSAAVNFYRKAAELGDGDAQFRLGRCLYEGKGTPENRCEAEQWLEKAIQQDHPEAKNFLSWHTQKLGYQPQPERKSARRTPVVV